jgi:hypothetical protein
MILATGATGNIGRVVTAALTAHHEDVRVLKPVDLGRSPSGRSRQRLAAPGILAVKQPGQRFLGHLAAEPQAGDALAGPLAHRLGHDDQTRFRSPPDASATPKGVKFQPTEGGQLQPASTAAMGGIDLAACSAS